MKSLDIPFNIKLLDPKDERFKLIRPVTSHDIFDSSNVNYHPDGLFSTVTFGKTGEQQRAERFGYLAIKAQVFHPKYFDALVNSKRLYADIVAGKAYAIWNDKEKDFEPSDPSGGETGFNFFLKHWKDINIPETQSPERREKNKVIHAYRHVALTDKVMVIPAGMRDIEMTDDGRVQEDEINGLYRKILSIANTISDEARNRQSMVNDAARYKLQQTFNDVYYTLNTLIEGKKKFVLQKWSSRAIVDGTRNVISPLDEGIVVLGAPGNIGPNHSVMGLYQALRSTLRLSIYEMKNGFLASINNGPGMPVRLINAKTLKQEEIRLKPDDYDKWFSEEGIDKLFALYKSEEMRHQPVIVNGHYMALIYKGLDGTVRLMHDIDDLPEGYDKKLVSPATYTEIIYLSCIGRISKLPLFVTRYPIAGLGSIYPSFCYVRTTAVSEKRWVLDENWERHEGNFVPSFPIRGEAFHNTLSPNAIRLVGLGADFDGDMCSANMVETDEAIEEVRQLFKKKVAYVDTNGRLIASANVDTAKLVVFNMSR
jgi:hypothetical protein